jgi:DNA-binding response OmpR family regulator
MAHLLVIDDDKDVALGLKLLLERAGHRVTSAGDGSVGLRAFFDSPADLVVLDVSMPVMDGWATLERLRVVSDVPVLMLTARGLLHERVRGLRAGADDYQTKPFANEELLARVGALLRRRPSGREESQVYVDEYLTMDALSREVSADGRLVRLTPLEFKLLGAFVTHAKQALSHAQLVELTWGDASAADPSAVKTYVRHLRRKLGWGSGSASPIESLRGVGYRYRGGRA